MKSSSKLSYISLNDNDHIPNSRSSVGVRPSPLGIGLIVLFIFAFLLYFASLYSSSSDESIGPRQVSMKSLLVAGIDIAERGGKQVKMVRESNDLNEDSKGETMEGANDPLTAGDLLSHKVMMESFKLSFPSVTVVSEEKTQVTVSEDIKPAPISNTEVDQLVLEPDEEVDVDDITVWIDPLDATQEYTENLLQYVTTMVCVAVKGKPTIGIIHKPFEGKTYWSWVKHGSNIEDDSKQDTHAIIVSRSHAGDVTEKAKEAFGDDAEVIPAGGAGYKSLALFNGKASVYVHTTIIKKWDICPGSAVLRHAGGRMTTISGEEIDFSNPNGDPKNYGGLVAALHGHETYLEKLGRVL